MAEVVGVVVGIASFSIQIADGIKKLADFCQAVKDAPADLQDALMELADLGELYEEIGQQTKDQQMSYPAALSSMKVLDRILERSKRDHKGLQALLVDMEAEVKRRQTRGPIKAVLKKETLSRFQRRVERTKHTLQISYTFYCSELSRQEAQYMRTETQYMRAEMQNLSLMPPHLSAIASQVSVMAPQVDVLVTQATPVATSTRHTINYDWHDNVRNMQRQQKYKNTTTYRLRFPMWLHSRVYELAYSHSTNVRTTRFRIYNNVSSSSSFFKACGVDLDYDVVKSMLLVEPAHVFDQDQHGLTPLHYVARHEHVRPIVLDLMNLLVDAGADISRRRQYDYPSETPSDTFAMFACLSDTDSLEIEPETATTLRAILSLLQFSTIIEDKEGHELEWLVTLVRVRPRSSMLKLIQESMSPPWFTRPLKHRLSSMAKGYFKFDARNGVWGPQDYEAILGSKLTSTVWETDRQADHSIFCRVMHDFGKAVRSGNADIVHQWRKVILEAVSVGTSIIQELSHRGPNNVSTPVREYLLGFLSYQLARPSYESNQIDRDPGRTCQTGVVSLAAELQRAGLGLIEYGQQVQASLRNMYLEVEIPGSVTDSNSISLVCFRVVGLWYCSDPGDWQLYLSDMRNEYLDMCCGDFWDMIEHPERAIPGAWSEEALGFRMWVWEMQSHCDYIYHYPSVSKARVSLQLSASHNQG